MSCSIDEVESRFDSIYDKISRRGGSSDSHVVASAVLVLASAVQDCDFQVDLGDVASAVDRIAEHCSGQLGEIASALQTQATAMADQASAYETVADAIKDQQ